MSESVEVEGERRARAKAEKPPARIEIIEDFCKGCEICVVVCPTHVLEMKPDPTRWVGSIAVVARPEACTRCMLCEVHCPDFAIKVF